MKLSFYLLKLKIIFYFLEIMLVCDASTTHLCIFTQIPVQRLNCGSEPLQEIDQFIYNCQKVFKCCMKVC